MQASRRHPVMNRFLFAGLILALLFCAGAARAAEASSAKQYDKVRAIYFAFKADPKKKQFRHDWIQVIARFQTFLKANKESKQACRAAYTEAELWRGLYDVSRVNADIRHAFSAYEVAEEACRGTTLADDALWQQVVITAKRKTRYPEATELAERLVQDFPVSDMASRARQWLREHGVARPEGDAKKAQKAPRVKGRLLGRNDAEDKVKSEIVRVKSWSNDDYVRVAIYLDKPSEFRVGSIAGEKAGNAGGRIFVDIPKSTTAVKTINLDTPVVQGVRLANRDGGSTRVVLDLGQPKTDYTTLILENPFRIVVDVANEGTRTSPSKPSYKPRLHKTLVVIDPGHGGKDTGATGHKGIKEKDVALKISLELKRVLEAAGLSARLTRTNDEFVALEERTAMANRLNADIFLSIHANAHDDSRVHGVESYYLDSTND
ncbi:MAG: N-acetylmuramoyl-L-alanine amidase, partial [Deltaproteobacteria bacterium]|nr:N-acetylmuramoyl-L-alanine amidase [Deltaproteobacteria bacterium]